MFSKWKLLLLLVVVVLVVICWWFLFLSCRKKASSFGINFLNLFLEHYLLMTKFVLTISGIIFPSSCQDLEALWYFITYLIVNLIGCPVGYCFLMLTSFSNWAESLFFKWWTISFKCRFSCWPSMWCSWCQFFKQKLEKCGKLEYLFSLYSCWNGNH